MSQPSGIKNILVVRPDRIGDVLLSTPVIDALRKAIPNSRISFMTQAAIHPILKELNGIDELITWDPNGRHRGIRGLFKLIEEFRLHDFKIAVVLHPHWKIAAALYGARVSYRIGPWSKFYSYLFFNRGVFQRRSLVEMHEADYNLQLLKRLGIRTHPSQFLTQVVVSKEAQASGEDWLISHGWDPKKPLIVVHPGMGGSALNWPRSHYIELIRTLANQGHQIVVTAGPSEEEILSEIRKSLGDLSEKKYQVWFYGGNESKTIDYLAAIISKAKVVIAPSTGPLHLAVALQKRVVTFFPPVRVQSAIRWGPYIRDEALATTLVPEVFCGQDFKCLGKKCTYYFCMRMITVAQAIEEVHHQLERV